VAMWLMDHQMNMKVSEEFGQYFVRLPLTKAAKIVHGNALRLDWSEVVPKEQLSYILGNPPFVGKQHQNEEQKSDMNWVFGLMADSGVLDYVAAWYVKAAHYITDLPHIHEKIVEDANAKDTDPVNHVFGLFDKVDLKIRNLDIRCAFVSTNSISQGEQVGVLWSYLFNTFSLKIHFAHRTFSWSNEARGNAAVHVVIIGFGANDISNKRLYDYDDIKGEPQERKVKNINPYLAEGNDLVIKAQTYPICNVPKMIYGSKPVDNGNFLFTDEEKAEFIQKEPLAESYIKPILSSHEFINGKNRWCLWLLGASPNDLRRMPLVLERLEAVRKFRANSTKPSVRTQAATPGLFSEIRQPKSDFIVIPQHSSENRRYIPFGFFGSEVIVHNSCTALPKADLYLFGQLTSQMHMTWVKYTCGRIKSDYRYSNTLVQCKLNFFVYFGD